jgi:peptidoglycan/xylan/chitin deacetylase (PgdA/CDA1 family)
MPEQTLPEQTIPGQTGPGQSRSGQTPPEPASGRLLVLMYHGVHATASDPGRFDPRYSVSPQAFEQQMRQLQAHPGDSWLPAADAPFQLPPSRGDHAPVLVSFDDGDVSNALEALPRLQAAGQRAVFFVTSEFIGRAGMLAPSQLRALAAAGMQIGSHGASHRFLSSLDTPALYSELQRSRDALQQIIGGAVDLLALPGGRGGPRELDAALTVGYRAVFGSQPGDNRGWRPGRYLQRIPITRDLSAAGFAQILNWGGPTVRRMRWRHSLLSMPKRVLGDERYDRLRQALVG